MALAIQRDITQLDQDIFTLGREIATRMHGEAPSVFNANYWHGRLLEWVMRDPTFKVDMFRFVEALPALHSTEQVVQHVREYLLREQRELPGVLHMALKAATHGLTAGLAARAIKKNITDMAERFIVGEDAQRALPALRKLHLDGIATTVDILGEATLSEAEAAANQAQYLTLIDTLAEAVPQWPEDMVIDTNHLGNIPRANVSLKVSALAPGLDAVDTVGSVSRLKERLLPVCLRAKERQVFLNIDLEQWALHGITYDLFEELASHPDLRSWPHLGIVVQAYLTTAHQDVERLRALARRRGAPLTVRLVKGAYWDYEVVQARQHGYSCPVFLEKAATDASYERLSAALLENFEEVSPAFGSHNLRSVAHALALARELRVPPQAYEVQMLYGMAEPTRLALRGMGYRVRVYAPVGALLPGMAYLVRRLLENTANDGFLRLSWHEKVDLATLLAPPQPRQTARPEAGEVSPSRAARTGGDACHGPAPAFTNCPLTDFTNPTARRDFALAMERVAHTLPQAIPVVCAGQRQSDGQQYLRYSPSDTHVLVARVRMATRQDADVAVASAMQAWPEWRDCPLGERIALLERLAERLQTERAWLAALQTFEVGKPWREADAEVAEAIDFCRYYARQARLELAPQQQGSMAGETNILWYEGRGPAVVIAPWNFPLAILCGMTTAALVAGNPVLMKPAEQASAVAYALYERMLAVGFPPEVVHFLPGMGEEVGAHLVAHPSIAQIAFTGSKAVGLGILAQAARTSAGQTQVKRVVCEMGGKNAIIVDADADLDEAVSGVMTSAFGYAGQKCSACSRVLVVGSVLEPFLARLVDACRSLTIAPAQAPACQLGPVIDESAYERLRRVIARPGPGATPVYLGEAPTGGWYVAPAIFMVQDPQHALMQEELFGPILAVMPVASYDEALRIAVSTVYALTGAVYSRTPSHLEAAKQRFRVGNLYLNRGSTGAAVYRQPFGGFGMSGLGTKAGGPGYLWQFSDMRCVSENTMRHGYTPDLQE